MGISAFGDGKFFVDLSSRFKYAWNDDKTLSVWSSEPRNIWIRTNRGVFIEALDASGAVAFEGGDGEWFYIPTGKKPLHLRYKKLPNPKLSTDDLDALRQTVTRYLVCDRPYNLSIPDTLSGAVKWLSAKLADIPKSSRAKASFRFDTTTEYGETYPEIEITYSELESDAEVIARVKIERERERVATKRERAQFDALKKKLAAE